MGGVLEVLMIEYTRIFWNEPTCIMELIQYLCVFPCLVALPSIRDYVIYILIVSSRKPHNLFKIAVSRFPLTSLLLFFVFLCMKLRLHTTPHVVHSVVYKFPSFRLILYFFGPFFFFFSNSFARYSICHVNRN